MSEFESMRNSLISPNKSRPVVFYLDNSNIADVDLSNPEQGNPGCGGTEYTTVYVASELAKRNSSVKLMVKVPGKFPMHLAVIQGNSMLDAIRVANEMCAVLVVRAHIFDNSDLMDIPDSLKSVSIILWMHLTPTQEQLRRIARTRHIVSVVCVEENQFTRISDNPVFKKTRVIPCPLPRVESSIDITDRLPRFVYLGALVPQKGFHILADAWAEFSREFPQVELRVVGSGQLYGKNLKMGRFGIASVEYENRIFRKLSPYDKSVIFEGNVSLAKKKEIFKECRFGIVNPSGETETFCLSAVELQSAGLPTIAPRRFGLKNTVKQEDGNFTFKKGNLLKALRKSMLAPYDWNYLSMRVSAGVRSRYDVDKVMMLWEKLLRELENPDLNQARPRNKPSDLQGRIALLNRQVNRYCGYKLPTLVEYREYSGKIFALLGRKCRALLRFGRNRKNETS